MTELQASLSTAANIAEIIGASTIVTGVLFGWIQLRHYRIQQRDAIASELMRTFYSADLAQAISLIQKVPNGVSLAELRGMGADYEAAAVTVTTSFETMGLLVFKRIADLALVNDLAGGIITTMNRKLRRVQGELRVEQEQPSWGEWFQWLGDQVDHIKSQHEPAHVKHRAWRP